MATKTFDQLTAASTIALTDILALEHDPAGTPATQKMTLTQLQSSLTITTDVAAALSQTALQAAQIAARGAADLGYYVISGLTLTPNATPTKLDMATGSAQFNTTAIIPAAQTAISTTITSMADATNPKWVAVELDSSAVVQFNQGTAAATPAFPAPTASRVVLGWLYIPANATNVDTLLSTSNGLAKLIDARVLNPTPYGGHVNALFGDGSDGPLTYDGSTTVLGVAPIANIVYILTRDVYATDITFSGTVTTISLNGFRIFCSGTMRASVTVGVNCSGATGVASGTGAAGAAAGSVAGGAAGGAGAAGTSGAAGPTTSCSLGAAGGAGGLATGGGTGGGTAAAAATAPTAAQGGPAHSALTAITGGTFGGSGYTNFQGGTGGAGGTAAAGTGVGGGGGGGGGIAVVAARLVVVDTGVTLTIFADGGVGRNATAGSSAGVGGGGGGGGGFACLVYWVKTVVGTLTMRAAGAAGGVLTGTGRTGATGSNGTTAQIQV